MPGHAHRTGAVDHRLPAGCDYQGRRLPRPFKPAGQPMPAEASTDLGADDARMERLGVRMGLAVIITTGVPFVLALASLAMWLLAGVPQ